MSKKHKKTSMLMRCASYCTATNYDIDELAKFLRSTGYEPKFYDEVIHIQNNYTEKEEGSHIFYFPYGCIIFWGIAEEEEMGFLNDLKPFQTNSLQYRSADAYTYLYDDSDKTYINEEADEIILESDDLLIKLAISHALAQSVKLTAFEESAVRTIARTRYLPEELKSQGKISLSRKELSKQMGELFTERNSVNLHSDILYIPRFFWRRPRYEPYYHVAAEYVDIATRITILNKRLDVIHELYEILSGELNHLHSSRLEWIIIVLIMLEVVISVLHNFLKWI